MFEDAITQAETIQREFEAAVEGVQGDGRLSDAGKQEKFSVLDAQRRERVAQLEAETRRRIDAELTKTNAEVERIRREYFDAKRQELGDGVLSDLYRRQIHTLDAEGMTAMYDDATPGFERALVRELIRVELAERDEFNGAYIGLLNHIDDTPAGLRELEFRRRELAFDDVLQKLDVEAYRRQFSDRYGVTVESMRNVPIA